MCSIKHFASHSPWAEPVLLARDWQSVRRLAGLRQQGRTASPMCSCRPVKSRESSIMLLQDVPTCHIESHNKVCFEASVLRADRSHSYWDVVCPLLPADTKRYFGSPILCVGHAS